MHVFLRLAWLVSFLVDVSCAFRPSKQRNRWQAFSNSSATQVVSSRVMSSVGATSGGKDLFVEEYTHVHIAPSSHRTTRKERRRGIATVDDVASVVTRADAGSPKKEDPVTLVIALATRAVTDEVTLYLPKGYELLQKAMIPHSGNCGALLSNYDHSGTTANVFAKDTNASALAGLVEKCEVHNAGGGEETAGSAPYIWLKLRPDESGLSKFEDSGRQAASTQDATTKWVNLKWFWFGINVWYPETSVAKHDNYFKLVWHHSHTGTWNGFEVVSGFAVLGDWECVLGEWESWSGCTAACGTGHMKRVRRIVSKRISSCKDALKLQIQDMPSKADSTFVNDCKVVVTDAGHVKACAFDDHIFAEKRCNTHRCKEGCTVKMSDGVPATFNSECTALCGGGVKVTRHVWEGEHCPPQSEEKSYSLATCNTNLPCKSECKRGHEHIAISECSALCGYGTMYVLQQVIEKRLGEDCEHVKFQTKCMRQPCSPHGPYGSMTVVLPDRNSLPLAMSWSTVAIVFTTDQVWSNMEIFAPNGFRFDEPGSVEIKIEKHDLFPGEVLYPTVAKDDVRVLQFKFPLSLPASNAKCRIGSVALQQHEASCRYTIYVRVKNRICEREAVQGFLPGMKMCETVLAHNEWEILFKGDDTRSGAGSDSRRMTGAGYKLYPKGFSSGMISQNSARMAATYDQSIRQLVNKQVSAAKLRADGETSLVNSFLNHRHDRASREQFCSDNSNCEEGICKSLRCVA